MPKKEASEKSGKKPAKKAVKAPKKSAKNKEDKKEEKKDIKVKEAEKPAEKEERKSAEEKPEEAKAEAKTEEGEKEIFEESGRTEEKPAKEAEAEPKVKIKAKKEKKEKPPKTGAENKPKRKMSRKSAIVTALIILAVIAVLAGLWGLGKMEERDGNVCFDRGEGKMMKAEEAVRIAMEGECGKEGTLSDERTCDGMTGIWSIGLIPDDEVKEEICDPLCIVDFRAESAEIYWRCDKEIMGQISPEREGMAFEECSARGGRTVDTSMEPVCKEGEADAGEVAGYFTDIHICCVPFSEEDRLTAEGAAGIAAQSVCADYGTLSEDAEQYIYNPYSHTWWIDLEMSEEFAKEGCSPACVVAEVKETAEINWRCTGLIIPEEEEESVVPEEAPEDANIEIMEFYE